MKKNEIRVGGHYVAKVNDRLVTVRVDAITEAGRYDVTNLSTGRTTYFRSAMKFRREVRADEPRTGANGTVANPIGRSKITDDLATRIDGMDAQDTAESLDEISPPFVESVSAPATTVEPSPATLAPKLGRAFAATPKSTGLTPTTEQAAILDLAKTLGKGNVLVIQAGAGTGKTSTLKMLEGVLNGLGQYTAFNSSLVKESASKFKRAACNTTHSLAFRAVGKKYAKRLNCGRVRSERIAEMLGISGMTLTGVDAAGEPTTRSLSASLLASKVMGAIKRFCQSADREVSGDHFAYIDGIDSPGDDGRRTYTNNEIVRERLLPFARDAWKDLSKVDGVLPFSHDCYVKIWQLDKPVIAADYILLDESQDTAPVMLDIIKQQKALVILVGDSSQSIYEWRGAVDAMAAYPDAPELYLSQSFRFGPAVASVANQVLERIGTKMRLKGHEPIPSKVCAVANPTAILCRTNAVAVGKLLSLIGEGKRPFLVGGGADVITFVEGAKDLQAGKSTGHPDLACFGSWVEVQEYAKSDEGEDLKLLVKLIDSFGCDVIITALRGMPQEKDADTVICTAHKSKGREWHSVKLASDFPTLSKTTDADLKLLYVAVTRAKIELDVSECPFFTGEDALEVIPTAKTTPESILPPTPAVVSVDGFSWAKNGDKWSVRGPKGNEGKTVEVSRRDGSRSNVKLGKSVKEYDNATIYEVVR